MVNLAEFNFAGLADYLPLKSMLDEYSYNIYSNEVIDNDMFIQAVRDGENNKKIAIFYNVTFLAININKLEFHIPIFFYQCKFNNILKFTHTHFFYQLFFHSVTFEQSAKFKLSFFYNGVSFINSVFKDETSFERVKFISTSIKYNKIEISDLKIEFPSLFHKRNTIDFLGVTFKKDASFVNSFFGCSILFASYRNHHTVFCAEADFSCITDEIEILNFINDDKAYNKEIELPLDRFHRITFQEVKFYGEVNFENRNFQKKTSFVNSIFYKAPKFHNAVVHQDTDFRGADFLDTSTDGAEQAYRSLKLIMDKKKARREEGMFFALEQESMLNTPIKAYNIKALNWLRVIINNFIIRCVSKQQNQNLINVKSLHHSGFYVSLTEKIFSFAYFALSNYGQSLKRPILILLSLLLILFPILYKILLINITVMDVTWGKAYHLSLQQFFRPFEIYTTKFSEQYNNLSFMFYFLTTLHSMINVGLLTIFILAVRGRFKMY